MSTKDIKMAEARDTTEEAGDEYEVEEDDKRQKMGTGDSR